jgi:FlaA1/EpsC-like NDP-sugar epimerase
MNFFTKHKIKKIFILLVGDIFLIAFSCFGAFLLRFDGSLPEEYFKSLFWFIVLVVCVVIPIFIYERLYSISLSFVSLGELLRLARAVLIAFLMIGTGLFLFKEYDFFQGFPRSILFIAPFLIFLTTGFFRFSKRLYFKAIQKKYSKDSEKVLIVGAGDSGEELVRHINLGSEKKYLPVAFVDNNSSKQGVIIHGVKVLGKIKDIVDVCSQEDIQTIIIALPQQASKKDIKEAVSEARKAKIKTIKILPSTTELLSGQADLKEIRDISIEDVLGREPVDLDINKIKEFLSGETILITGVAGSIGSQLAHQVLSFNPEQLIGIDQNETGVFNIKRELNKKFPNLKKEFIISDICNEERINRIFKKHKPTIVFHAAAYKHVPLMEAQPEEAVKNNVFGTLNIVKAAKENKVKKFVFISTDKAVNPTSVMGATKQIGERVCLWFNNHNENNTKFCAVRFGNVLDSQGNVVGIFKKQIKQGGPVQVTHPEMKRYFMITSEACLLVTQAAALSEGGEVFVLDMGEPVKVVDLAREMIKLAGYEPDVDIPIVFTKPRPGEKLFEEILTDSEKPTKYKKIFMAQLNSINEKEIKKGIKELKSCSDNKKIIKILKKLIPSYKTDYLD